ncbi:MAG: acetate--CoA ligase [Firmicutes bacterium]|nr:acetate--CoA ligase [Bacillota bacterium]
MEERNLSAFLRERRTFKPDEEFARAANVNSEDIYRKAALDPEGFWAEQASHLEWMKPIEKVLQWDPPHAQWFIGGKLNASVNCIDRHLSSWRRNKAALIWEGEDGSERVLTYYDLHREVGRMANVLKGLGVKKGDIVTIYMPMIPEVIVAMLSCARIGAAHSVVFAGFSTEALRDRIIDARSNVVITANASYRRGKLVHLKEIVDESLEGLDFVTDVVVYRRVPEAEYHTEMKHGRDHWWSDLMAHASIECPPAEMDSEDMLFVLYTSGTTGKPKGIVHTTGGYLTGVNATTRWVFDVKEEDVYWCTADVGWITGHSYLVYGPLSNGVSVVVYEGAPDYPERDRFWEIIEKYGVTIFYTAPTAIRTFMRWGTEWLEEHDLSSLRLLGSVGEPINPEAWMWYYEHVGDGRCPIVDTWWQTETGAIMISPLPGISKLKPGSATRPLPGIEADIVDWRGRPVPPGQGGYLVIKKPWPSMLRTVLNDEERYVSTYWSRYPGMYFTGDGAKRDEDDFFWLLGRIDDVLKVAGHRIGTMEVESALVSHPSVAEAAVIGIEDEIKGQAICAFVTLKDGQEPSPDMIKLLKNHVAETIGPIARPQKLIYTAELPKTRSGKIMRRLLRDIAEGRAVGDVTTLADPKVIEELVELYADLEDVS